MDNCPQVTFTDYDSNWDWHICNDKRTVNSYVLKDILNMYVNCRTKPVGHNAHRSNNGDNIVYSMESNKEYLDNVV